MPPVAMGLPSLKPCKNGRTAMRECLSFFYALRPRPRPAANRVASAAATQADAGCNGFPYSSAITDGERTSGGHGRTADRDDRGQRPATARGAMAAHPVGDGRHPVRHDHGVLDAEPDHAAVSAGARGQVGERGRFVGRRPRRGDVFCCGFRLALVGPPCRPPRAKIDAVAVEPRGRTVRRVNGRQATSGRSSPFAR